MNYRDNGVKSTIGKRDLIFSKLNLEKNASNRELRKGESTEPIDKDSLFRLSKGHMGQTKLIVLANVGLQIQNSDVAASKVIGKGVGNPEGLWE